MVQHHHRIIGEKKHTTISKHQEVQVSIICVALLFVALAIYV